MRSMCWNIDAALKGQVEETLLDSYEMRAAPCGSSSVPPCGKAGLHPGTRH